MRRLFCLVVVLLVASPLWAAPFKSTQDIPSVEGFTKVTVLDGLEKPWSMAWLPDGSMLITEKPGRVRLFQDGALSSPLDGAPDVLAMGQGGMMEVSLHPDFASNQLVYFTYSSGSSKANRTTMARAKFDGAQFTDLEELFRVSQDKSGGQHFGSRILWLEDGTMLLAIGDGGNPPTTLDGVLIRTMAQSRSSHLGKILHLNDDGTPVADGPFADKPGALPELYSIGHRNIQGITHDPIRGMVWATEHGALGGDELNIIKPGENYGWPAVTFSKEYRGAREISEHTTLPGKQDPIVVWTPALAPSGLAIVTSDVYPAWKGDLFAGGLKDQSVRRVILDDAGKVTGEEIIRVGQRVRDVRQGPDGKLYLLTDESNGQLIRLDPSDETDPNP